MHIRPLDPVSDRALVDAFFVEATDYILLERDEPPGPDVTEEFFTDTPPGCDPATSLRIGLFKDGHLIAVGETAFGYPEPHDAYLGLMIVSPVHAALARVHSSCAISRQRLWLARRRTSTSPFWTPTRAVNPSGSAKASQSLRPTAR